MRGETCYKINQPKVINEVIEGETIIIDLESGHYYSLDSLGTEVWERLENSKPVKQIVSEFTSRFMSNGETIEKGVQAFIDRLLDESLIVKNGTQPDAPDEKVEASSTPKDLPQFSPPQIQKFDDMQGLLLADPIHDVDESGWPNVKPIYE